MYIDELMTNLLTIDGVTDIFLSAGKHPSIRVNGQVEQHTEFEPIPAEEIDAFRIAISGPGGDEVYRECESYDCAFSSADGRRFRLNFCSSFYGPECIARPIKNGGIITFSGLNLPEKILEPIGEAPRGLILISGTAGNGKSTTMNALINYINTKFQKHILTIEDPIEFIHDDINSLVTQREIGVGGAGFAAALKGALRENPDVIVIGEIRDPETVRYALSASLTGHLVVSTVHSTDTVRTVERLIGMFPEGNRHQVAQELALALFAVVSQRLIPTQYGDSRVPAIEVLRATETMKRQVALMDYDGMELTLEAGSSRGMLTFNRSLFNLYDSGVISLNDALRASTYPDDLRLLVRGVKSTGEIGKFYGISEGEDVPELVDMNSLLRAAVKNHASDLMLSVSVPPVLRINGVCNALELPALTPADTQRLITSIISGRQRRELEERRELDFAVAVENRSDHSGTPLARFRVNAFYQRGSLALVARVVNDRIPEPEELGIPFVLRNLMTKKQGLIIITGPTGSGKSTTLASLINEVNHTRPCHIVTIEDPVEYIYRNDMAVIEQRELNSDTNSFSNALSSVLRQAPDVILVGEMRDTATMAAALTAAETGHLVLSTLHTNSAPQTVERIIDSFAASQQNQIRQQFSASILAVVSQRLLPTSNGKGRVASFEVMVGTSAVKALIRENKTHQLQSALELGAKEGMITMEQSLEELVARRAITQESMDAYILTRREENGKR